MKHLYPFRFDRLASKKRTPENNRQLGVLLAFIAGYINAGGFFIVSHYTSHMTGILSEAADALSIGTFETAFQMLAYITCFIAGATTTTLIILRARHFAIHSQFSLPLLLEALLLAMVLALGLLSPNETGLIPLTIGLLCFLMGLQNALITKASTAIVRTTHVTGMTTDLGIEIGRWLSGAAKGDSIAKMVLFSSVMITFLLGGLAGALIIREAAYFGLLPVIGLLVMMCLPSIWKDLRFAFRRHNRRSKHHPHDPA